MSKQIMIAERPADSAVKQSIGNYKGVMLCNRPNDPADRPAREGPAPFISRVTVKEQLGINPAIKQVENLQRPKKTLEILNRHRQWLFQLQKQKDEDIQKEIEKSRAQEEKLKKMKKKYSGGRTQEEDKTRSQGPAPDNLDDPQKPEELQKVAKEANMKPEKPEKPEKKVKLTEKTLKQLEKDSKPKWAMTQEQAEEMEELEVDDLLEYVQGLDYDKFIEDLEIRQALEIVKERVEEIKKDKEWKTKIAEKYNEEDKSVNSRGSLKSYESKARSQISRADKGQEWDKSTRSDRVSITEEERVAKIVADQVLANYPNLKAVHSNASVRRMLEKEAKNQLTGPLISTIKEEPVKPDPSNLPYLHRNPAV